METGTPEERKKVADQIKSIRRFERRESVDEWNRDMVDYIDRLGGISNFLNYVRSLREDGIVLDIGSGTNKGITEIARSKMGHDLNFIGTNLSKASNAVEDTSPVKIVRTPAETLRGIEDESISGVLALASIAYSASPKLVVSSIDRVLIPNGAIKSFFRPLGGENEFSNEYQFKTHLKFSEAFRKLGYDVAIEGKGVDEHLMLAIKPGDAQPQGGAKGRLKADTSMMDKIMIYEGHF